MGRTTAYKNGAHVVECGIRIMLLLLGIPPKLICLERFVLFTQLEGPMFTDMPDMEQTAV